MFLVFTLLYIAYDYLLATNSIVSRAITISSSRWNYNYLHLTVVSRDNSFSPRTLSLTSLLILMPRYSRFLQASRAGRSGSHLHRCEYDSVNATGSCSVSTNVLLDTILIHTESQLSLLVTLSLAARSRCRAYQKKYL